MADPPSSRTTVRRKSARGRYDEETVWAILDEGLVCHLGVVTDLGPVVIPTAYARSAASKPASAASYLARLACSPHGRPWS